MKLKRLMSAGAGVLAVSVLVAGCASGGAKSEAGESRQLTFVSYGGDPQAKHIEAWTGNWAKENSVDIRQDSPPDIAKLIAQVDSGKVSWDLVHVEPHMARILSKDGMLEPIDLSGMDTDGVNLEATTEGYSIPAIGAAYPISYNTDVFPDAHPSTWKEFFDTEKFPGKRAMTKYVSAGPIEAALLADGVAPEELYPLDIDRALAKLDTIKDDIIWFDTGDQLVELLSTGEAPLAIGWAGRIEAAAVGGRPVANEWNEHIVAWDQWVIPKGAPNADLAREWIKYHLQDLEGQAQAAREVFYGPANNKALDLLTDEARKSLPNAHAEERGALIDPVYWAKEFDSVNEKFTTWVSK